MSVFVSDTETTRNSGIGWQHLLPGKARWICFLRLFSGSFVSPWSFSLILPCSPVWESEREYTVCGIQAFLLCAKYVWFQTIYCLEINIFSAVFIFCFLNQNHMLFCLVNLAHCKAHISLQCGGLWIRILWINTDSKTYLLSLHMKWLCSSSCTPLTL